MELFCQKLIDMVISRASLEDIASCSLVARKWRSTSQRRHFRAITLNQRGIVRWYTKVPQDPNGIPSYVQVVVLDAVTHCFEPYTLAGLLPSLTNLRDLFVIDTDLTLLGEPQGGNSVSFDHSYQSVTQLWLICNAFALPTFNSLVLSLPNLTTLSILRPRSIVSGSTPTAPPVPARVLEWFNLSANGASAFTVAFQFRPFKFRNLTLACDRESVLSQFIGNSATTVETLSINNMPPISKGADLPPLPALRELCLFGYYGTPSTWLPNFLRSIHSAPALSGIQLLFETGPSLLVEGDDLWVSIDRSLVQLMERKGGVGLTVRIMGPLADEGGSKLENLLSGFMEAGGELRLEPLS